MDYIIRYENISLGSIHSVGSRLFIYWERTFLFITLKLCKNTKNKGKTRKIYKKCTWLYNAQPGNRFHFPIHFSYARMTSSKEKRINAWQEKKKEERKRVQNV